MKEKRVFLRVSSIEKGKLSKEAVSKAWISIKNPPEGGKCEKTLFTLIVPKEINQMEINIDVMQIVSYLWICLGLVLVTQLIVAVFALTVKIVKAIIPVVVTITLAIYRVFKALFQVPSYWLAVLFWFLTLYIYFSSAEAQSVVEQLNLLPIS